MRGPKALKVRPGSGERTYRLSGYVTRHCSVKPERLTLVTVESRARPGSAREGFDFTPAKASLFRAALVRQHTLIAQVDHVLPR